MSEAFPLPVMDAVSAPFWEAAAEHRLVFQKCQECGHRWFPAKSECQACLASNYSWVDAQGGGTLVSWVVYHRPYHPAFADRLPYVVAVVDLDEQVRMFSNIVGWQDPEAFSIGQRLNVVFEHEPGVVVPQFSVAGGEQ